MRQDAGARLQFFVSHILRFTAFILTACRENRQSQTNDAPKQATNIGFVQPEIQGLATILRRGLFRPLRQRCGTLIIKD